MTTLQEEDTKIETNFDDNNEVAAMTASNEEEGKAAIESSIPKGISDTMNPVKPITPVTFPESGTESEVSETEQHYILITTRYLYWVFS